MSMEQPDRSCSSIPGSDGTPKHPCPKPPPEAQKHVHEFLGSTQLAELEEDPHNHRFAGVSGEAISKGTSHVHQVITNTDFYEDHHHQVIAETGFPIDVGNDRHVHFVAFHTTTVEDHFHEFRFATLIQDPISD